MNATIDDEIGRIISTIDRPKRRKDIPEAISQLRQCWKKHYATLLSILKSPEYDRPKEYTGPRYPYGPIKEIIWQAVLQSPTKKIVDDLSFLASHDDPYIRWVFAIDIANIGKPFALGLVEQALRDPDEEVRIGASIGLRDRSHETFSKAFAARAGQLLFQYFLRYPDDEGGPRHEALEIFAPRKYARIEKELDEADPLRPLLRAVFDVANGKYSHKDIVAAFKGSPLGYKYIYALNYVDADIRNGGIYQLHYNPTWHWILDAIEGAEAFEFDELSTNLREILFYYYQKGRSRMKKRIPDDFFDDLPDSWRKSLALLEEEYYTCFERRGIGDLTDLWKEALKNDSSILR